MKKLVFMLLLIFVVPANFVFAADCSTAFREKKQVVVCQTIALSKTPWWKRLLSFGISDGYRLEKSSIKTDIPGGITSIRCLLARNRDILALANVVARQIGNQNVETELAFCSDGAQKTNFLYSRALDKIELVDDSEAAAAAFTIAAALATDQTVVDMQQLNEMASL